MSDLSSVVPVEPTPPERPRYCLRLFVAGDEPVSRRARENLAALCETHLRDRCEVEIIDVLVDFRSALEHNVFVTPALIVLAPPPRVTILGSLNNTAKVLTALGLAKGEP